MGDRLKNKVAIVSAAAGAGMGQAVARRFAEEGAEVVVTDAHERRVRETADQMSADFGREILSFKVDVRDTAEIEACVDGTVARHGRVDVLYNNAGINKLAPVWELADADWAMVQDVCLGGCFRFSRAALRHMVAQRSGVVINVSSIAGWHGDTGGGGQAAYAAAKAGVMGLTRAAAAEVGPYGVRVNAIAPGLVYNAFLDRIYDARWFEAKANETVLGRMGRAEDVTGVATFIASEEAGFITGEVFCVSGGRYMHA